MAKPSSYAFWLIISIVGIICCSIVASLLVLKSKRFKKPEVKQEKAVEQVKQNDEDKGKGGGWFGTPAAAAGGMVTNFLTSVPSRLEELSVYSGSDSGTLSESSKRSPAQGSSGQQQPPSVKGTKKANRFDFKKLRPAALNGKSRQVSPQSGQGQQPPPSDATITSSLNTSSLNTSSLNTPGPGQDMEKMADQIIQEHSEEIMSGVMTDKLGQAFTRLGALVEETIFPINADDRMEEDRQRKEHRGSKRRGDRYESGANQSRHRSDQDNSLSIATDSFQSNSEADSSSSSASRDRFESFEYASSLSEEEYDNSATPPSNSAAMMPQPVASYDNSVYKAILSSLHRSAVLKPIHVTLTDISPQYDSAGFKIWERGESHFSLDIVAEEFEGLTMARRHRLIYMLLGNTMDKIYSLEIKARSPSEM